MSFFSRWRRKRAESATTIRSRSAPSCAAKKSNATRSASVRTRCRSSFVFCFFFFFVSFAVKKKPMMVLHFQGRWRYLVFTELLKCSRLLVSLAIGSLFCFVIQGGRGEASRRQSPPPARPFRRRPARRRPRRRLQESAVILWKPRLDFSMKSTPYSIPSSMREQKMVSTEAVRWRWWGDRVT